MNRKSASAAALVFLSAFFISISLGNASAPPCRMAKGDSPVAKACAEGGLPRAKESMRALVKQGRAAGAHFTCDDCHSDQDRYEQLAPEAKQNFARLLALLPRTN